MLQHRPLPGAGKNRLDGAFELPDGLRQGEVKEEQRVGALAGPRPTRDPRLAAELLLKPAQDLGQAGLLLGRTPFEERVGHEAGGLLFFNPVLEAPAHGPELHLQRGGRAPDFAQNV